MRCGEFENFIALEVEGDLDAAGAARVREHVGQCDSCRAVWLGLRESQAALKALAEVEIDEQALAQWRGRVLAQIDGAPRRGWGWRWALAAAAVLLVWIGVHEWRPYGPPAPPPVVARMEPAPAVPVPVAPARRRRIRPVRRQAPAGPLLVKLETADPNVVIYWIVEGKGD
jgi:hypothetical protein